MKEKNILIRRYLGMTAGVFILSIGIAMFKVSHLGNDPMTALNISLADLFGISLGQQNLIANTLFLLLQIAFGRKYIGAGTFVNGVLIGYAVSFFYDIWVCRGKGVDCAVGLGLHCRGSNFSGGLFIPDGRPGGGSL